MRREPIDAALQFLADSGIAIELSGGSITAKPTALVTAEVVEVIREHKPALVRLLRLAGGLAPDEATQRYLDSIELVDPEPIGRPLPVKLPEANGDRYCHCGRRMEPAMDVGGWRNFDCPGCGHVVPLKVPEAVRVAAAGSEQGGLFR